MPRKSLEATIDPKVLVWARESIGMGIKEAARKAEISVNTLEKLESGEKKPTLNQVKEFARIYKRPLAAFFLSGPPEEPPPPKDFRTLSDAEKKTFSQKTYLAIRRARRLQSIAVDLIEEEGTSIRPSTVEVKISDNPESVAKRIRNQFGLDVKTQFAWHDEYQAFNKWVQHVEKNGILVFQLDIPIEESRGFSLHEGKMPVIVLNQHDAISGRIFSLFHEYAHLLLHDGGVCGALNNESLKAEMFCNHYSGAFLVPKDELLNHQLVKSNESSQKWPDESIRILSRDFKVSREVILRRLLLMEKTNEAFYRKKREEWNIEIEEKRSREKEKEFIPPPPEKRCVSSNGVPFVSLVLNTHRQGKITNSDVSDFLAVRLKHIPKIEEIIRAKTR